MDQNMNDYLAQLRERAEKRLNNDTEPSTSSTVLPPASSTPEPVVPVTPPVEKQQMNVVLEPTISVQETPKQSSTVTETTPLNSITSSLDRESNETMSKLMDWSTKESTVAFEPVAIESPVVAPSATPAPTPTSHEEVSTHSSVEQNEKSKEELREEKRRAREVRRALVNKQNGTSRGIIGEILYIILFIILVILTIFAVLYLLQTIAGVQILDVESLFNRVFGLITN